MSFRLSPGTMDSMAGVFAPPKKYRMGSGGGSPKRPKVGGTMLGMAVASMFAKPAKSSSSSRPSAQAKHAFGGGSQTRMTGRALMIAERTSRRVPEVMVRITGRQHGGGHVLANFAYISRLGHGGDKELGLETSDGETIRDGREMQALAKEWHEYEMGGDARRKGATSLSMILSMPSGTDPERLKAAALDFAREEFANRSWVASLHVDREHPHVHLTIARRDHDGRRFHPNRDDLFRWRQRFAQKLRDRGIEANATPARARGIDPKHEHIAVQKIRDKGLVPRTDVSRAERAQRLREQGIADPVQANLASRQAAVRETYARSITELSGSPSIADQVVARSLEKLMTTMPAPEANSARAMRLAREEEMEHAVPDVDVRPIAAGSEPDPIAAALERSRAMQEKIEARKALREVAGRGENAPSDRVEKSPSDRATIPPDDRADRPPDAPRPSVVSERFRSLIEASEKQVTTPTSDKVEEVLREILDRDRTVRDRDLDWDRSQDRDGPGR